MSSTIPLISRERKTLTSNHWTQKKRPRHYASENPDPDLWLIEQYVDYHYVAIVYTSTVSSLILYRWAFNHV